MALRLGRSIHQERTIPLGYGVSMTFRPFTYAEYKEIRAAAYKMARENLSPQAQASMEIVDDEDMPKEVEHELQGRVEHWVLLLLIVRFCRSWEGLLTEDEETETPAPINIGYAGSFLDSFPGAAEVLGRQLLMPYKMVEQEGNGSAPSPNGASAVG